MRGAKFILRHTLLLTAANLVIRGISMLFQVFLSSRLGAAGVGLWTLVTSVWFLAVTIGYSGARVSATLLTASELGGRNPLGARRVMSCCLGYTALISTFAGLTLITASDLVARVWIGDLRAAPALKILACVLPLTCLSSVMGGYFTAVGRLGKYVALEIIERLLSIAFTAALLAASPDGGVERSCAAVAGGTALSTAAVFIALYLVYRRDRAGLSKSGSGAGALGKMLRLTVPLALTDYVRSGLGTVENLLIPRGLRSYGSSGDEALASYGVIHGMVFPVMMLPVALLYSLSDLLLPELAECRAQNDSRRIAALGQRVLRLGAIFSVGVAGTLLALSFELGELIYKSAEAGRFLRIFSPLVALLYMDTLVDSLLKGAGEQIASMRINVLTSALDVLLLLALLPYFGLGGYFAVFTFTHALNFALSALHLWKTTGCAVPLPFIGRCCLCYAAALLPVQLLRDAMALDSLLLMLPLLALYAGALVFSKTLSMPELRWLRRLFWA